MEVLGIDHVGIHVTDVERSLAFYVGLFGFEPLPRPDLGFAGAWLRVGRTQELHLIDRNSSPDVPPEERHWSIQVRELDDWHTRLADAGLELRGPKDRPDGARQLFVRDPDGHVLELLERPAR
jgi:catechol 2,3-dioxygenase-like lactoylglutathione lyase family enzyme